jgi:hypothetical protein
VPIQRGGILKAYTANNDKTNATVKANAYLIANYASYATCTEGKNSIK